MGERGWLGRKEEGNLLRTAAPSPRSYPSGVRVGGGTHPELIFWEGGKRSRRRGGDPNGYSLHPHHYHQPSSARQTASSPARAGAADKYLKLKGQEEGWGAAKGARRARAGGRRRRREIRQRSRASLRAPNQKGGCGSRGVPRPPGPGDTFKWPGKGDACKKDQEEQEARAAAVLDGRAGLGWVRGCCYLSFASRGRS